MKLKMSLLCILLSISTVGKGGSGVFDINEALTMPIKVDEVEMALDARRVLINEVIICNCNGSLHRTLLMVCAHHENVEVAQKMFDRGADPNIQAEGDTALHWAAGAGRDLVVQLLIENGADPNMQAEDGDTALHRAFYGAPSRDSHETEKCARYERVVEILHAPTNLSLRNHRHLDGERMRRSSHSHDDNYGVSILDLARHKFGQHLENYTPLYSSQ